MAITDDLRKTLTDPTPLYFAAGTADLAVQQARKVPALIEQLRAEAPERIEAVRNTDPKVVQEKVTGQAKEAQASFQARVTEVIGAFDTDLKKLGESAQDLALRGVGVAAEYAVRARETYEKVAERGEQTVRTWRGETAEEIVEIAVVVEPRKESEPAAAKPAPAAPAKDGAKAAPKPAAKPAPAARTVKAEAKPAPAAGKKAPARKPAAKKTTPPTAK
uniref:Heparin binding hemagglutinin HbhA n=1 Tax=Streptomyces sp. NBC_00008 TaxID=2903610 RepID=A0AAU2VQJ5_9ACTN